MPRVSSAEQALPSGVYPIPVHRDSVSEEKQRLHGHAIRIHEAMLEFDERIKDDSFMRELLPKDPYGEPVVFSEKELARYLVECRIRWGRSYDTEAWDSLIHEHAWLVEKCVRRYSALVKHEKSLQLSDLKQAGNMGLMHAPLYFDPLRGERFDKYAQWWVLHGVRKVLQKELLTVYVPADMQDMFRFVRRLESAYEAEHGERLSAEYIMEAFSIPPQKMQRFLDCVWVYDDRDVQLGDTLQEEALTPEDIAYANEVRVLVREAVKNALLTPRERDVLERARGLRDRWGEATLLADIGREDGTSRAASHELYHKALNVLRHSMGVPRGNRYRTKLRL